MKSTEFTSTMKNRMKIHRLWTTLVLGLLTWSGNAYSLDICGCAGNPQSLGHFHSDDEATWPTNTLRISTSIISIPLPDDGVLIFDSFTVDNTQNGIYNAHVVFELNPANTVVTLLVSGDLTVGKSDSISLNGKNGTWGSSAVNGIGGLGGPGGFRGGDGAYEYINNQNDGGAGLGPGGGDGATIATVDDPAISAQGGQFVGIPELLPMIGGSGGGGGRSESIDTGCAGGGAGGGGGGLLIALNGTATINGSITANGGARGQYGKNGCSSHGAGGSGGAIRVVADTIIGDGAIKALGSHGATNGAIRLEAFNNTLPGGASYTNPVATRALAPGPLANPITPSVAITSVYGEVVSRVNGELLSELPQGWAGEVDVLVSAPDTIAVAVASNDVPAGTTVDVTFKPSPGGLPHTETVTLGNCIDGGCTAQVFRYLEPGVHVIEARATFQTP